MTHENTKKMHWIIIEEKYFWQMIEQKSMIFVFVFDKDRVKRPSEHNFHHSKKILWRLYRNYLYCVWYMCELLSMKITAGIFSIERINVYSDSDKKRRNNNFSNMIITIIIIIIVLRVLRPCYYYCHLYHHHIYLFALQLSWKISRFIMKQISQ